MTLINTWLPNEAQAYLQKKHLINSNDKVTTFAPAGEGNMNFTFRTTLSSGKSLIIKQAPPFCAKFPQVVAPIERIFQENLYYQLSGVDSQLAQRSPEVYFFDESLSLIVMKDLGEALDYGDLYSGNTLEQSEFSSLIQYLSQLHKLPMNDISMPNLSMRTLNHAYIFALPFNSNDAINLDAITPGLNAVAASIHADSVLKQAAHESGEIYLNSESCLIHGDFYPRSWLKTTRGPMIIDPEFGHIGSREFDIAVFLAHLALTQADPKSVETVKIHYEDWDKCDQRLMAKFYGVEIIRRILHIAQLPIKDDLEFKKSLIDKARTSIIEEKI